MEIPPVLIVPGWTNAGPEHWQSLWQIAQPSWRRVEQVDWECPQVQDWLDTLSRYVEQSPTPPLLVAHSLGCIAVVKWAAETHNEVAGAFLVAPADVESNNAPAAIKNFAPIPTQKMRFATHVVVSSDDEFLSLERASDFADWWGSDLTNIGSAGHIATASGYGEWPEGRVLLSRFSNSLNPIE